ncbi:unnamed protein product, partial [Brassica napus]
LGLKLVSCTSSPILVRSLRENSSLYSILEPLWDPKRNFTSTFGLLSRYHPINLREKWDKLRDAGYYNEWFQVITDKSADSYSVSLLLSPVVSVWDCVVRKMRYTYVPEWV